jgi:hypothetical protein
MRFTVSADTAYTAVLAGHFDVLKFLNSEACPLDKWSCTAAAYRGDLDMLIWLRERYCPWDVLAVTIAAASSGDVLMMMWLKEQNVDLYAVLMLHAADRGLLPMCHYLADQGILGDDLACIHAMRWGHTETLRWLMHSNSPYQVYYLSRAAAKFGNIDVMAVILEGPEPVTADHLTNMLNTAGHLEAAQWLRQRGAGWPAVLLDEYTGSRGVYRHHWCGAILDWARREGCISPVTVDEPAAQGD